MISNTWLCAVMLLLSEAGALEVKCPIHTNRRAALVVGFSSAAAAVAPSVVSAKCTDIESCREIGNAKVEQADIENPTIRLNDGVRYKKIKTGFGDDVVSLDSIVDITYSISQSNGAYMYSLGRGLEKGADGSSDEAASYKVRMGAAERDVPVGIENSLVGMKRGELRRVSLPPAVGFGTSNWRPAPTSRRGRQTIIGYQQVLNGNGSTQPPFPASTIWDVEVARINKRKQ